jgi:chromosome segregation ATPase
VFRSSDRRPADGSDGSLERLSGRVDFLTDRVDALAQTVAATAAGMAKKDGEIALLRRDLDAGLGRIEAASRSTEASSGAKELRELRDRIAALAAERTRGTDDRGLGTLEVKVTNLAERVDTLATTVATTAAGLAGREGEIAALRRRLDEEPRGGGSPASDMSLRKRIDDLGAAAASASMRLESHSTQIAALRDALDARRDTLESALAILAERVDRTEGERAELAKSVAEAAGVRWRELERTLASVAERLGALERDHSAEASALKRATSLWPAALRSLEARVAELARAHERRSAVGPGSMPSPAPAVSTAPVSSAHSAEAVQRFLVEIRALERRLESAEAHSREDRDDLRARVLRLEGEQRSASEEDRLPVGADVLPFRGPEP